MYSIVIVIMNERAEGSIAMAYFPMFVDIEDKKCLVVGGGEIAYKKIVALRDFDAVVSVVSKEISDKIKSKYLNDCKVILEEREYTVTDIEEAFLVVAATDNNDVNSAISKLCNERRIPVNVVDKMKQCSFIFPAYTKNSNLVTATSSSGKSPVISQYVRDNIEKYMNEVAGGLDIGRLNDYMGEIRPIVKKKVTDEKKRKQVYKEILENAIKTKEIPDKPIL